MLFARTTQHILNTAYRYNHTMSVFSSSRLIGKTALITGASSGIGAATAELFSRAGANVVILARRQALLDQVKAKCEEAHKANGFKDAKVVAFEMDMTDRKAIDGILDKTGGLPVDILVNNAGLVRGREHVGDISGEDIDIMFQTNVIGLFHLTQILVRDFKKRNTGFIVNLGSVAGIEPYAGGSIYCATKHALNAFSGSLMRELVNTNIRVAEIQPGMVETEFSVVRYRGDKDRAHNEYKGLTPLTGEDVAEEIVWVASRPEHVQIAQILMFPSAQASATVNYRKPE
jgi:3-hydroxy acid dehydrogenase/malonic semialdehyde reductase